MGLAFSARSPPYSSFALSIFSAFITYASADLANFVKFFPCWFSICGKSEHLCSIHSF